jgi:signal transduction histidine kinase
MKTVEGAQTDVGSSMRESMLRSTFVTVAMGLSAVAAVALATQAVGAARDRSATARRVLLDYAALSAEQGSARLQTSLGNPTYRVLIAAAQMRGKLSRESFRAGLPPDAQAMFDKVERIYRVGPGAQVVTLLGDPVTTVEAARIFRAVDQGTKLLPPTAYSGMNWVRADTGVTDLLAFQPLRDSGSAVAYTVPARAAIELASPVLIRRPLLPQSLTNGVPMIAGIGIRVLGCDGEVLLDHGFVPASPFRSSHPLGYLFADLAVEVSLDEALAPKLIIGGLPRTRVPLLLTVVGITLVLTVAAAYQLRSERALAKLQEDFVTSVSHELRTPVAQIRMFAETLRLGRVRSVREETRYLQIIEKECRHLKNLIDNLLHYARSDRTRFAIAPQSIDIAPLICDVATEFGPIAAAAHAALSLDLPADGWALVDEAAFRQILLNLLDNAVRYGRLGQVVTIRLRPDDQYQWLEVEDQGDGIPASARRHIWKRFWRGGLPQHSAVTGTGLGLAIVRDLVELHHGTAAVETGAEGGARFVIGFPRRVAT